MDVVAPRAGLRRAPRDRAWPAPDVLSNGEDRIPGAPPAAVAAEGGKRRGAWKEHGALGDPVGRAGKVGLRSSPPRRGETSCRASASLSGICKFGS